MTMTTDPWTDALLAIMSTPSPFRETPTGTIDIDAETELGFEVFQEGRDSSTGETWREPTGQKFATYREADAYADGLNAVHDWRGGWFWFVADNAEEDS